MTELQTLNQEYLAAAASDPERLAREFEAITEYMKGSTAIHHGEYVRTCYEPKLFTEEIFARFSADIRTLYGILGKVMHAYYQDPAYRALFAFDPVAEELILRANPDISLLPMARIDFFYNEETGAYKYCEFNTDGTSAMNEDRELNRAQQLSSVYRAFRQEHATRTCELFHSWVHTLCAVYQRARHTDHVPYVAIVDFMDCGTVNEFQVFQQFFEEDGVPAEVCDIRDLRYDAAQKALYGPGGHKIDAIYRRAVTVIFWTVWRNVPRCWPPCGRMPCCWWAISTPSWCTTRPSSASCTSPAPSRCSRRRNRLLCRLMCP